MVELNVFTPDRKVVLSAPLSSLDEALFASAYHDLTILAEATARGLEHKEFLFGNIPMLDFSRMLAFSRFKFFNDIRNAYLSKSKAKYLLWHKEKTDDFGFLLQYLPPNSVTSNHYHVGQTEIFSPLEGAVTLDTSEGIFYLRPGDKHTVNPNVVHKLYTGSVPCLNIIEIINFHLKDHHLVGESNAK